MGQAHRALCADLVDYWERPCRALWADGCDARTLARRLRALPGFGPEKTQIFIALLAKRFDVRPDGWEAAGSLR
ncbi:MAG: hypothetical protein R2697_07870 [Ilumatobacteraceae bacterium]